MMILAALFVVLVVLGAFVWREMKCPIGGSVDNSRLSNRSVSYQAKHGLRQRVYRQQDHASPVNQGL